MSVVVPGPAALLPEFGTRRRPFLRPPSVRSIQTNKDEWDRPPGTGDRQWVDMSTKATSPAHPRPHPRHRYPTSVSVRTFHFGPGPVATCPPWYYGRYDPHSSFIASRARPGTTDRYGLLHAYCRGRTARKGRSRGGPRLRLGPAPASSTASRYPE